MPMRFKDKIEGTITNADYASSAGSASKIGTNAGSATTPVYFSNGVPVALGYTIQTSVPANAKFTDTNTTYNDFTAATASAAGAHGLVPAPAAGQQNYFLRGDKTWQALSKSSVGLGNVDNTADANKSVKSATTATSATNDSKSQAITSYIRGLSISGKTITYTKGDGTTGTITTQDTTYSDMKGATASAAGTHGLVPAPAAGAQAKYLRGDGTWASPPNDNTTYNDFTGATASAAGAHGLVPAPAKGVTTQYLKSTGTWGAVAWGEISGKPSTFTPASHTHKYASSFSVSGTTVTVTYGDGTTSTFTTQDSNTDTKVTQNAVTASDYTNWRTLIWGASNSGTEGFTPTTVTDQVFSSSVFSCQPSTGTIKATTFKGALSGNASTATALTSSAGNATTPVYFSGGKPVALGYTIAKSVPADANFSNTWRGIQDNLTSTATDQSLSANQGKVLKGLVDGKAASNHTHNYAGSSSAGGAANSANFLNKNSTFNTTGQAGIQYYDAEIKGATDVKTNGWGSPTEAWYQVIHMPLSVGGYFNDIAIPVNDINGIAYRQRRNDSYYGWYRLLDSNNWKSYVTKSTLGLGSVDNTADSAKSVKYATSAGSATSATTASKLGTNAGNATTPVYFADGVPKALGYTIAKSVPADANFSNTWRGIQDNLTSTSTSDSLSANQGKVLKGLVDGKAASSHTHKYASSFSVSGTTVTVTYGDNTTSTFTTQDTNTTYGTFKAATSSAAGGTGLVPAPAAGAQTKYLRGDGTWAVPTDHTYNNFGGASGTGAGSAGLVPAPGSGVTTQYLKSTGAWAAVAWGEISGKPSTFTPASHTHNYAGSSSAGGSATSAVKLDTATAGSATQPVYFTGGKPVACTYTLGKSVPSNAVFTDTHTLTLADRVSGTVVSCTAIPTT